jgi:uncharacterized membrane protein
MNIRDMSFGDLTKVGYWIVFAPYVPFLIIGLIVLIPVAIFAPEALSQELDTEVGPMGILGFGFLIGLIITLFVAFSALVTAVFGAVFVRLYTWLFMGSDMTEM